MKKTHFLFHPVLLCVLLFFTTLLISCSDDEGAQPIEATQPENPVSETGPTAASNTIYLLPDSYTVLGNCPTTGRQTDNGSTNTTESKEQNILEGNVLENDSDPQGDAFVSVTLATPCENGQVCLNSDGSFVYIPGSGFVGRDSFSYTVCDNGTPEVACGTETVSIAILPLKCSQNN